MYENKAGSLSRGAFMTSWCCIPTKRYVIPGFSWGGSFLLYMLPSMLVVLHLLRYVSLSVDKNTSQYYGETQTVLGVLPVK